MILAMLFAILGPGAKAWGGQSKGTGDSYELVTTPPTDWSGTYLFVYVNGTSAFVYNGTDSGAKNGVSATISNNTITFASGMAEIEVASMTGGYSLKVIGGTNNGKYLSGKTSNSTEFNATAVANSLSMNTDGTVKINNNTTTSFQFNSASDQQRFRYFKSAQKGVKLYKKQSAPTHTLTLSATNGSITAMNGETVIESGDNVEEGAELDITATADDWYKFSGWSVTGTGSSVESTTTNPTTFTMGTADATLTATFAACVVTVSSNDENWGIALYDDESHTISTAAEDGYRISTTAPYTINPANAATLTAGEDGEYIVSSVKDQDVEITINFEALPSVAYTVTFNAGTNGTCSTTELTEAEAGAGVTLPNCTPNAGYQFVGWATTETATEAEYEAGATYYPTANITLYAVYNQVYTITWSVNGTHTTDGNPTTSVVAGEGITTLPTTPADISGMAFQGWTATQIETPSTTAPTDLFTDAEHAPAITANTTFYAVFAEKSEGDVTWVKKSVSEISEGGVYAIITTDGHAFNGNISSSGHGQVTTTAFSFTNNVAAPAPSGTCEITFEAVTGGFKMYNADNGYLYASAASSGKLAWHNTEDSYWYYNSSDNGNWMYKLNSARLRSYNNESIRTYNANNGNVLAFAKKTQDITYTYYTNVVVKVLTSIELSGEYPTEFWKGETFSHEGMMVTAHYDDESTKDVTSSATFTGYDMATAGEQTVTVTYDTKSATYNITVKTIANTQENAYTVAEAIALIDNGNDLGTKVYVKGTVSKIVTAWDSQDGNITFDVSADGQTTGDQFRFYGNFKAENTQWASAAECPAVGDDVIGIGTMKKYGSIYEFTAGNYLVSHVKAATLSIDDITVSLGGEIEPVITSNVPEAERKITYSVASEDVVKVDEEGNLVTVAVGGPVTVTAKLTAEDYKDATTTFEVTVIKALQSIAVKTAPTKLEYKEGDLFNPAGLVITANYNEGEPEEIAYEENEEKFTFEPSLETELTTNITIVTITYAGKTTTQTITVHALNTYDITWKANGEQFTTTKVTEGDALALPETNPANVGDMVFQGWINTENYYHAETAPEYIVPSDIIPTEAMTFYAVYAKEHKDIQETTSTMDFSEETYSDWEIDDKIVRTANQGTGGTGDFAGKINANNTYITFNKKVKVESFGFSFKRTTTNENYNVYIETSTDDENWTARQTYPMKDFGNGSYTTKTDDTFDGKTDLYVRFHCYNTTATRYVDDVIIKYMGEDITYSNFCTTVKPIEENTTISENTVWDGNVTISGNTVTIGSDAVLTVNGALVNTNPANLVIKEGGQLIVNNKGVQATMEKNIDNTSKESNVNWYTISSPLAANTEFKNVTNLIPTTVAATDYDLYYLDEANGMWINSRIYGDDDDYPVIANPDFTTIDKGRGYIYSNTTAADIAFAGEVNVADVECNLTIGAANGFNLIGNPFSQNIKLTDVKSDGTTKLADGFYVLTNQNTWGTELTTEKIKPLQGFLVQATTAGSVTISKPTSAPSKGERSNEQSTNIELIVSNANFKDNAYAMFGEGIGLNKVSHRNAQAPMLYIPQDGEDFAIAFMDESTTIFPVSFKAMTTGNYSISLKPTDNISTLVLVDNQTGTETNMLLEESYKFIGSPADNDNRFTVKLELSHNDGQADSEHFVYQNGSELVINGEGTLQIFDVLGRVVISEEVHGQTVNVGGLNTGAYIVRLTGESVMTQKIVVR